MSHSSLGRKDRVPPGCPRQDLKSPKRSKTTQAPPMDTARTKHHRNGCACLSMTDPNGNDTRNETVNQPPNTSNFETMTRDAARLSGLLRITLDFQEDPRTRRSRVQLVVAHSKEDNEIHEKDTHKIPIYLVPPPCLVKVIQFLNHYAIEPMHEIRPGDWDSPTSVYTLDQVITQAWYLGFCSDLNNNVDMASAMHKTAEYMDIPPLQDLMNVLVQLKRKRCRIA